jgi:N-acetylglucosaminyl-diphospho-decaprenol L-rhamnosyltransferase
MKLTIQIVNFRSRHYLKECLFSIAENLPKGLDVEIIIVNNDEDMLDLGWLPDNATVVEINQNIGFGWAQNAGFAQSKGEYVLFFNPDAKILPGALPALLETISRDKNIGIVGPVQLDSRNQIQADCFGWEKTPISTISEKIFPGKARHIEAAKSFPVDWVSGAAMLVRSEVFRELGGFDEKYFMYFEDIDLCRRAKCSGYRVMVDSSAQIFHESGKSFESEQEKKKYYYSSQEYYIKKHFGDAWALVMKIFRFPYYVKNVWFG